ncbi:MAG TPA: hypothetical protein V6D02_10040 [Candidatus Obscuribacterales bacterium]
MATHPALLKTLGLSGLTFLGVGLLIRQVFPIPAVTLLIDHSYCPPAQWQQVANTYDTLYRQHRRRQIQIQQVVLFNALGVDRLPAPPIPEVIQQLPTYGQPSRDRQENIEKDYPHARLLDCRP